MTGLADVGRFKICVKDCVSPGFRPLVLDVNELVSSVSCSLLAMITLSTVQSSAQTFIHNAIMFIDTPNNA